jgi:hypothetical protein
MRFTDAQFYYMRRIAQGNVTKNEFWSWRQQPLRGLYVRGMFKFMGSPRQYGYVEISPRGWDALQGCLHPQKRKDATRPIFDVKLALKAKHA